MALHIPDFTKVPDSIGFIRVYEGSDDRVVENIASVVDESQLPIYLPDFYVNGEQAWVKSIPSHGQIMLLHLLTMDINHDGIADIEPRRVFPMNLAKAYTTKTEEEGAIAHRTYIAINNRLFGTGFPALPQGIINQSYGYGYPQFRYTAERFVGLIPERIRTADLSMHTYTKNALTPAERKHLEGYIFSRAAYHLHDPSNTRSMNHTAWIGMADEINLDAEISLRHIAVQSAGNGRDFDWFAAPGKDLLSVPWIVSSVIAVGGLADDGTYDTHAVRLADVGAPFTATFTLTYEANDRVKWTNTRTGLSFHTDLDKAPYEATYIVSDVLPKAFHREGFNRSIYIYTKTKTKTTYSTLDANGYLAHEPGPRKPYIHLRAVDGSTSSVWVHSAKKRITYDVLGRPVQGSVYYKDADYNGIPDRVQEITVHGTSPANQYAIALVSLVQQGHEHHMTTRGGTMTIPEFNRRLIASLHKHTGGKILPGHVSQELIDTLQKEIFTN